MLGKGCIRPLHDYVKTEYREPFNNPKYCQIYINIEKIFIIRY